MITTFTYSPAGISESGQAYMFANINGKTYHIVRGYRLQNREIFLQVAGTTALRPSDLGQHWEVMGSKGFHTAYVSRYFHYQSERADLQLAFVGNSTAGSRFLALWFISRRFGLGCSETVLAELSERETQQWTSYRYSTSYLDDFASQDQNRRAVCMDFQYFGSPETATEFIEQIKNNEEEDNND